MRPTSPWVVDEANLGGIGPRWGPTGLVAASITMSNLIIADPATHATRRVTVGTLVGGGPTIVWSADGGGIVDSHGEIHPIDGGPTGARASRRCSIHGGSYGAGLGRAARLSGRGLRGRSRRPRRACRGRRVDPDDLAAKTGDDRAYRRRASAARRRRVLAERGSRTAVGRSISCTCATATEDAIATVNRNGGLAVTSLPQTKRPTMLGASNLDLTAAPNRPRCSSRSLADAPTFHRGQFAGFVDSASSAAFATVDGRDAGCDAAARRRASTVCRRSTS